VYFPNGGVSSITTVLPDSTVVEAAAIGDEGVPGIEALFSDNALATGGTLMQVPDTDVVRMDLPSCSRA
jgi:hypothetical protein